MNLRTNPPIPFIDVAAQRRRLGPAIDAAVAKILNHCQFILGPEVRTFEAELAAFCDARHVVTCASGTDALILALRAMGVGPGDAVLCPSFTFLATAMQRRSTSMPKALQARLRRQKKPASRRKRLFRWTCSACRPTTGRCGL